MTQKSNSGLQASAARMLPKLPMLTLVVIPVLAAGISWAKTANPNASTFDTIDELLRELDAKKFAVREAATEALTALGPEAIERAALHSLSASPEATWRAKRVLKQIATGADEEETSLKAISVLILLDNGADEELTGLLTEWKRNRSDRAMEFLLAKGAVPQAELDNRFLVGRQQIIQRTFPMILNEDAAKPNDEPAAESREKMNETQLREEIFRVVSMDAEDVRRHVADRLPSGLSEAQLLEQNPFLVEGRGAIRMVGRGNTNGTLEFGDRWQGDSKDRKRLREIDSLTAVQFTNLTLDETDSETIALLDGLTQIGFDQTKFSGRPLIALELPDSVQTIELGNQPIDRPTLLWLASHPLAHLSLNQCDIPTAALAGFSRFADLQSLELRGISIDQDLFAALESINGLNTVVLSGCEFEPADFRDFTSRIKPQTNVVLNPTGFLGVQAMANGQDPSAWTCRIDMVVAGSGADQAGLQTGDIIESVNGDAITVFEELRMHISLHGVGDQLELQVLRDGKRLKLTATLGENPNRLPR